MTMKEVKPKDRVKTIQSFIDATDIGDSIVIIRTKNVKDKQQVVESETCTFIYPTHLTGIRNTCRQLDDNLTRALEDTQ